MQVLSRDQLVFELPLHSSRKAYDNYQWHLVLIEYSFSFLCVCPLVTFPLLDTCVRETAVRRPECPLSNITRFPRFYLAFPLPILDDPPLSQPLS